MEAAPAIGNFLVLGERISDKRKGPLVGLEGFRERLRRRLALRRRPILQQVQRRLDRLLLAADLESQARNGLVEQPVESPVTGLGFFMKQLLDAVFKLVGLVLEEILDLGTIVPEFGGPHCGLDHGVLDAVEFKREEQQVHRSRRKPLGDIAIEFGDRRIDAVAGMYQPGI